MVYHINCVAPVSSSEMLNKLLEMTPEQIEQLPPLERAQAQAIIGMFRGQQQQQQALMR